jgi:uncharacterized membrane protein YphA (DoxX/SURF4 family)
VKQRLATWQPWLSTLARLLLAWVFVTAGWPKFIDGDGTVRSVRAFQLVPESLVKAFAYTLPPVELALALLLIVGLLTRYAAIITAALMVMFIFGIVMAWARGLSIDCGCFGNAGTYVTDPVPGYIRDLLRDTGFLLVAAALAWWPRSRFAVDSLLAVPQPIRP